MAIMSDNDSLELYLVIMRALESGPYKETAAKLKEELAKNLPDDKRIDFLGNKHQRDLRNFRARYPSLSYTNSLLANAVKDWFHLQHGPAWLNKDRTNIFHHLRARRIRARVPIVTLPPEIYSRIDLQKKIMGHLSPAYCICFDQTGQYVFTGSDDHLIKIWSAIDGRLLKTLRGHDGQICDIVVNYENRLLASTGMDKIIRIWDLRTTKLLECLTGYSATITSIKFAPYNRHGDYRYLISTSNDGHIVIWTYHAENFGFKRLMKNQERNRVGGQITCSSFSTGGSFLACGASDNYIHIYGFHPHMGPYWCAELQGHKDKVDSIQFCNNGFRFVSGSKDGTAIIWRFTRNKWTPLVLDMDTQFDQTVVRAPGRTQPPRVSIVQWSRDDRYVITSLLDWSIKVWDSQTGRLIYILKKHKHEIFLLESHPIDPRIFASASHDGALIIWDLSTGRMIKKINNTISPRESPEVRNVPAIYDMKFSPDGNIIATADSHGYLSLYGNGGREKYKEIPEEMFFHTDYRPVIRDVRHFVMDENTHQAPHLMPRPLLVDMNGNPHPHHLQHLVPDYQNGERFVIPPLKPLQLEKIARMIQAHSEQEDNEFLAEKKEADENPSDSDTIIDSDATEIDEEYIQSNFPSPSYYHQQVRYRTRSRGERPVQRQRQLARRTSDRLRRRVKRPRFT